MKIALFSDVHANLPALHAFFDNVKTRKPDALYCLGDLVGYHIWPNEVIRAIRRRSIPTIAGNHDAKVARLSEAERTSSSGKNYAYSLIAPEERYYLSTLPAHIRVEFQLNGEKLTLLLVHGSPSSNRKVLFALDKCFSFDPVSVRSIVKVFHGETGTQET
jgi:predicted phosphodiesterase